MKFKTGLLVLLVFVVGLGLWRVALAFSGEDYRVVDSGMSSNSFLPLDYIQETPVVEAELNAAFDEAKAWRPDAKLMAISMRFSGGLNYADLTHYNYTFSSGGQYLIVGNPRVTSRKSASAAEDLFGEVVPDPVNRTYLTINFVQALEIVERGGGGEFRVSHPGTDATLLLMDPHDGVLSWYVTYSAPDGAESTWAVNAASGFVEAGLVR